MSEGDYINSPFLESATNGLLSLLSQDEEIPNDVDLFDPYQNASMSFDVHDSDVFTDVSSVSTQRTRDFTPTPCMSFFSVYYM